MTATIMSRLAAEASQSEINTMSKKSLDWMRRRAAEITMRQADPRFLIADESRHRKTIKPGRMYMMRYDPKGKGTLPYYDTFPLIFPVAPVESGFHALNMHYLPPILRARLMDKLLDRTVNAAAMNETTKLLLDYQTLAGAARFAPFAPCYKHYLYGQMRSRLIYIPPEEWTAALFLPSHRFKKASATKVWKDSRGMIT